MILRHGTKIVPDTFFIVRHLIRLSQRLHIHARVRTHARSHETGETLHMSQQEKSPLWIQSPKETSRVLIGRTELID